MMNSFKRNERGKKRKTLHLDNTHDFNIFEAGEHKVLEQFTADSASADNEHFALTDLVKKSIAKDELHIMIAHYFCAVPVRSIVLGHFSLLCLVLFVCWFQQRKTNKKQRKTRIALFQHNSNVTIYCSGVC